MMILEHAAAAPAAAKRVKVRNPYVVVGRGESLMEAIARHRRETGYRGGVSVTFERARVA